MQASESMIPTRYSKVLIKTMSIYYVRELIFTTHLPISRMDLTPDDMSPTGQRVSSCRSAEISKAGIEYVFIKKNVRIRIEVRTVFSSTMDASKPESNNH